MVHVMLDASSLLLAKMVGCMQLFQWLHPLIILICAGYRIPRDPFGPPEKRDKVRQKYHRSPFSPHVLMCDAHQDVEESLAIEPDGSPSSPSASPLREAMCLVPMGISTNIVVLLGKT